MKLFIRCVFPFSIILFFSLSRPLLAQQENIRIMAYNILEYYNTSTMGDSTFRDPYFRTIMNTVNPDIIAAAELGGRVTYFLK